MNFRQDAEFTRMVDTLKQLGMDDAELGAAMEWVERMSKHLDVTRYDIIAILLQEYMNKEEAEVWVAARSDNNSLQPRQVIELTP